MNAITPTITLTKAAFEAWMQKARPGDRVVYHVGFLAKDRETSPELDALAEMMLGMAAMEPPALALTQTRVAEFTYSYAATVR